MKARTLITDALRSLRVLGIGDDLAAENASAALSRLNDWIDALALEPLTVFHVLRTTKDLASGTPSYTIGSGGNINIVRPTELEDARLVIDTAASPVTEIPLEILTDQRWQQLAQKDLQSPLARAVYYDRSWTAGLGRIYLWPVPNVATTRLVLYTRLALAEFADLDTDYTFPPGYRRFLRTNFIAEIAPEYGKTLTADQVHAARTSKAAVKRTNTRPVEATVDPALAPRGHRFDIRTGETR